MYDKIDWHHLKAFLNTAETGSWLAASRKLGQTQAKSMTSAELIVTKVSAGKEVTPIRS